MAAILAVRVTAAPAFTAPARRSDKVRPAPTRSPKIGSPQIRPTLLPRWQSGGAGQALACVWTVQQDDVQPQAEAGSRRGKPSLRLIRR